VSPRFPYHKSRKLAGREALLKMTHLWKSDKVAFGELLLGDFHQVLGKSSAKNGSAFPTFSTTPAPATILTTLQTSF